MRNLKNSVLNSEICNKSSILSGNFCLGPGVNFLSVSSFHLSFCLIPLIKEELYTSKQRSAQCYIVLAKAAKVGHC